MVNLDEGVVPLMMTETLEYFQVLSVNTQRLNFINFILFHWKQLLEAYGADVNIKIRGKNLLHLLFENPHLEIYQYAVQKRKSAFLIK